MSVREFFKLLWRMFSILYAGFFCTSMSMLLEGMSFYAISIFLLPPVGNMVISSETAIFFIGCIAGSSATVGLGASIIEAFRPWFWEFIQDSSG